MKNCADRGCLPPPERSTVCHCARCHVTLGTLTDFDRHNSERGKVIACRPPGALGLVPDERGVWRTLEGLAARDRKTEFLAGLRNAPGAPAG